MQRPRKVRIMGRRLTKWKIILAKCNGYVERMEMWLFNEGKTMESSNAKRDLKMGLGVVLFMVNCDVCP